MVRVKEQIKNNLKKYRGLWSFLHQLYWWSVYCWVRMWQYFVYRKLSRIYQQNTRKIRVGFLVTENEKWGCQTLFDKLKENPHFEPVLVLSSLNAKDKTILKEKFQKNLAFFEKACGHVIEAYDPQCDAFYSLKPYKLDIVFYQQPWGSAKEQNILTIYKFALPCYVPYGFEESYRLMKKNVAVFYDLLFRFYVTHSSIAQHYKKQGYRAENMCAVGYPKLEKYLSNAAQEKKSVMYAPHHAIEPNSLRLGTFAWSGHFMLEYAKQHPQFHWIFKPHPRCKETFVAEGLFKNRQKLEDYYNQWASIGEVYERGDYMDLFQQTRCLITDCCSFLVEFFPTQQPVIHLKRTDSNVGDIIMNSLVASTYYSVFDLTTLKQTLHAVLEEEKDPMRKNRVDKLNELKLVQPAAGNIIQDLEDSFFKRK